MEPLEGRQLLSLYTGPSSVRPLVTKSAVYQVSVSGGGFERITRAGNGVYNLTLVGTTPNSTLNVGVVRTRPHYTEAPLLIGNITIRSGQLGSIQGPGTVDLLGSVTPIVNSMSTIELNGIGPNAKLDVEGGLGSLTVNAIELGAAGHVNVQGSVNGAITLGEVMMNGGQFAIGGDVAGKLTVSGNVDLAQGATFSIGRDVLGGMTVAGDMTLDSNGSFSVGRELDGLTVTGDVVVTPSGGAISVGGDLDKLTIDGAFQGKGSVTPDLNVGLDLNDLVVLGGGADIGGLRDASINVGKEIVGINVQHGIFNSLVTAGVLIDGGSQSTASGGNVGPDGTSAIFDSQLLAGAEINNLVINGDVMSDYPTNPHPTGYPTRIIAGVTRQGVYSSGGLIDHFQITGTLIDSVVAASVKPNGGNGTLPTGGYNENLQPGNTPGDGGANTYDKPMGTVAVGTFASNVNVPNYTELSYVNETLTGVAYDPTDPTIDDFILGGGINPSYASTPAIDSAINVQNSGSGTVTNQTVPAPLAIPTTSTVLGGVVSTPHGDQFDYAGLFAADTSGVFIGVIPKQKG